MAATIWVYSCVQCGTQRPYLAGVIIATEPSCTVCGLYMPRTKATTIASLPNDEGGK
jgi:hypothetical protein